MRKVHGAELRDLEDHVEQAEFHPRHLINVEVAIDPLLLKQNNTMSLRGYFEVEAKQECIIQLSCSSQSFSSLFEVDHDERPHTHNVADGLKYGQH